MKLVIATSKAAEPKPPMAFLVSDNFNLGIVNELLPRQVDAAWRVDLVDNLIPLGGHNMETSSEGSVLQLLKQATFQGK